MTNFKSRLQDALIEDEREKEVLSIQDSFDQDSKKALFDRDVASSKEKSQLVDEEYEKMVFKTDRLDTFLSQMDSEFDEYQENIAFKKMKILALKNECKGKKSEYYVKVKKKEREDTLSRYLDEGLQHSEEALGNLSLMSAEIERKIEATLFKNREMKLLLDKKILKSRKIKAEITNREEKLKQLIEQEALLKSEIENFPSLEKIALEVHRKNVDEMALKEREIANAKKKKKAFMSQLDKINYKNKAQQISLDQLNFTLKGLVKVCLESEKQIENLMKKNADMENEKKIKISMHKKHRMEIERTHRETTDLLSKIDCNNKKNSHLDIAVKEALKEAIRWERECVKIKQKYIELSESSAKKVDQLQMGTNKVNQLTKKYQLIKENHQEQQKKSERLDSDLKVKKTEYFKIKGKKDKLKIDYARIAEKIQQKDERVAKLSLEIESLNGEYKSLENLLSNFYNRVV